MPSYQRLTVPTGRQTHTECVCINTLQQKLFSTDYAPGPIWSDKETATNRIGWVALLMGVSKVLHRLSAHEKCSRAIYWFDLLKLVSFASDSDSSTDFCFRSHWVEHVFSCFKTSFRLQGVTSVSKSNSANTLKMIYSLDLWELKKNRWYLITLRAKSAVGCVFSVWPHALSCLVSPKSFTGETGSIRHFQAPINKLTA